MRRVIGWTGVVIAAGILVLFAMPSYRQGEASIAGKPAQDFPITLSGKSERLSDLRGKVVVLNFWATWCPPCVEETPALNRLQKYIDSRNGMVLGVSVDDDGAAYEKFLKDQTVVFPTYRDVTKKSAGRLRHDHVSGNLRHRPAWKNRPQIRRRAAMGQPRNAGVL